MTSWLRSRGGAALGLLCLGLLAGCAAHRPAMAEPKAVVIVAASQPSTSPSPTARLTHTDRDYDAIAQRAEASCMAPSGEDEWDWRIKESNVNACLEEAADAELKAAISTGTPGAAELVGFAQALSTYEGALAELIETTSWIDPSTRMKHMGSGYDSASLGCGRQAVKERLRHWHARRLGDTAALARRFEASRQAGEETAAKLREWTRDRRRRSRTG